MKSNTPRVMIAAIGSGSGKTTLTCGILGALKARGYKLTAAKCGPDYIDPILHNKVFGINTVNLDSFICGDDTVKYLLARYSSDADFCLIEGVMGLYDGFNKDEHSSNHISVLSETPVILVINPTGMGFSVVALISGFLNFRQNNIKGIILNNVSEQSYAYYKALIQGELPVKVYGHLPSVAELRIENKRLGLDVFNDVEQKIRKASEVCAKYIDIDGILALGRSASPFEYNDIVLPKLGAVKIAIAQDEAFYFYYRSNLDLLEALGAELIPFSPIHDTIVPDCDAVIIGGGTPELYAPQLEQNKGMRDSIKRLFDKKTPFIAEGGGYMYITNSLTVNNVQYKMCGCIDTESFVTDKLVRFGYAAITAECDNLICNQGESFNSHEFHYADSSDNGDGFFAAKRGRSWACGHANEHLYAGFPHINFWGNISMAERFIIKSKKI